MRTPPLDGQRFSMLVGDVQQSLVGRDTAQTWTAFVLVLKRDALNHHHAPTPLLSPTPHLAGVLLYQMCALRLPFSAKSLAALAYAISQARCICRMHSQSCALTRFDLSSGPVHSVAAFAHASVSPAFAFVPGLARLTAAVCSAP